MADLASLAAVSTPRPPRPERLRIPGEQLLLAGLFLYVLVLVVLPLGRLFIEGLKQGEAGEWLGVVREAWAGRSFGRAFWNTLVAAGASTLLSVVLGTGAALLLRLTDLPGRAALMFLMLLPMLIPPQISALAWIGLGGPSSPILGLLGLAPPPGTTNPLYSMGGIIWVMGLEHAPLVLLAVAAGLASVPRDLIEAGRIVGARPARVVVHIILPAIAPSVLAGAALAFVSAIGNFGVPALLGIPGRVTLLTTLIYQRLNGFGPSVLGEVAAIAFVLVGLAIAGLAIRTIIQRRSGAAIDRTGPIADPFALGRLRLPVGVLTWVGVLLISVLPLLALIATALVPALGVKLSLETLSFANFAWVLSGSAMVQRAFVNSTILALIASAICCIVAVPLAYFAVTRRNRLAQLLDLLSDAPYAVPGTVLAIGIIIVFLPPLPVLGFSIYGSFAIILAAYLSRFLLLALRPVAATLRTVDPGLEEAARIVGTPPLRRLWHVMTPIVLPSALAGGLLIFMSAFNELTLSALLWSTGTETLGVMVFFLQYEGNSPAAAALATVITAAVMILALIVDVIGRRFAPGVVPWQV
ncbi:ABC transporter permease [Devosia enhydra]|uniref:ABC transporter permease n=1 Tax=Devosia enhydra TaxID=665118 RepID=UPI001FCD05F8|nr:iron ABC transporter permease [Devosia enhydra]